MAIKSFRIKLDGIIHEVEVEELYNTKVSSTTSQDILPMPESISKQTTPSISPSINDAISSPLPGTVLDICVTTGQLVKTGDVLIIIEAMKMENEIVAARGGKVAQIFVNKGTSVESGTPLLSIN